MSKNKRKILNDIKAALRVDPIRPIIFLDIDEVLNNNLHHNPDNFWYSCHAKYRIFRGDRVDDLLFRQFCTLAQSVNAIVIITSSWLQDWQTLDDEEIRQIRIFFKDVDILGSADTGGGLERGDSVDYIIEQCKPTFYAVVDDALRHPTAMYRPEFRAKHEEHLVAPAGYYGMTTKDFHKLIRLCGD